MENFAYVFVYFIFVNLRMEKKRDGISIKGTLVKRLSPTGKIDYIEESNCLEVGEGSLKRRIPPFPVASISSLRTINYHRRPIDVHVPLVLSLAN